MRMQGSRINTQGLLGHGRVMRIDKAAAAGTADKTSVIHDNGNTDNSYICVCNYGIPRSACREEIEARAKAAPPPLFLSFYLFYCLGGFF